MKVTVPGGTVYLRDRFDFATGQAVRYAIVAKAAELREEYGVGDNQELPDDALPDLRAAIAEHEIIRGVESWSFPQKVTRASVREVIMANDERATVVAEACDGLYAKQVISPLALLGSNSSPDTPTSESTSQPTSSSSTSEESPGGVDPVAEAPEAIEAILDFHYPDGRHRDDYERARWRLQFLAETGLGWRLRSADAEEDDAVKRLGRAMRGGR